MGSAGGGPHDSSVFTLLITTCEARAGELRRFLPGVRSAHYTSLREASNRTDGRCSTDCRFVLERHDLLGGTYRPLSEETPTPIT